MTVFTGTVPTVASGDTTTVPTNFATWRDLMKAASEAWTAYTPTWTGSGGNPVLNNGSFAGTGYARVNKLVIFRIVLTMGSTTTYGTGQWSLTVPVAPINAGRVSFLADFLDTGTAAYSGRMVLTAGSAAGQLLTGSQPNALVTSTAPHTWANTDQLTISGTYEAA